MPGIGRRSARRLAFFLARSPADEITALAASIADLTTQLHACERCGNLTGEAECSVCRDSRRDSSTLCVVEQPENVAAVEATGAFTGRYHVLGGAISPLRSVGPEDLRIDPLLKRVAAEKVGEVILATNPTVEGEATALYISRRLAGSGATVTRPATGLPVGGELDYIDRSTLARAFEGRRRLDG